MKNLINILIITGVTLSSFTTLRIGFIGPSELILLLAVLLIIISNRGLLLIKNNIFIWFWIIFLLSTCFSTILSFYYSGNLKEDMSSEVIAYLFTIVLIISYYTHFLRLKKKEIDKLLYRFYIINSIIFVLIFIYSKIYKSILGVKLYYGERLSLFSENPHQLSLYIGVIILFGLLFINKPLLSLKNSIIFINSIVLINIGISTLSTTFKVSLTISLIIILVFTILNLISNKKTRYSVMAIFILVSMVAILYIFIFHFEFIYNIFANDENGLGRIWLWSEALKYSADNVFVGYGFGTVIEVESNVIDTSEAHNILLDILLKAGILPAIIFVILILYTLFKMRYHSIYLGMVLFVFTYSMAGFTLKRVILWFVIIILYILVTKSKNRIKV
ncbi:O-antigen ligase family protein [Mammaliicoccus vitulinus]|uniref:O-antigen ligase family protein n=1 Tax=Mammaliicoccus vitulinus TaxID=71237 RepID=UPI00030D4F94|nr:O-antigen ligase family protein [Mammaliicoccus vitulinus]